MKKLKPGEWSDDHGGQEAWERFWRDKQKIQNLEAALEEAVELLREMREPHDDYGLRVEDFLDKHGREDAND